MIPASVITRLQPPSALPAGQAHPRQELELHPEEIGIMRVGDLAKVGDFIFVVWEFSTPLVPAEVEGRGLEIGQNPATATFEVFPSVIGQPRF